MKLFVSQTLENGRLGGPKEKQVSFLHDCTDYEIDIKQCGERQITISSSGTNTARNFQNVFYNLETLLMLFDGQFYSVIRAIENDKEVTESFRRRRTPNYKSADLMIGEGNQLIDFESVLSDELLMRRINLRDELDLIHNMMLYCVSSVQIPVDMKCAFMVEAFLGIGELVNVKNPNFILPSVKNGESKLEKYITALIEYYGQEIFFEECKSNKEQFAKILKDSRNRIAHIKSKQGHRFLNGKESVLYLAKLSMLYRVILFDLLGIPKETYNNNLQRRTDVLNQYQGILGDFLKS